MAALLTGRPASAADVGVLPLAAPQVDAATRAMAQESLLTAVQAVLGDNVEPGELKKRLGPQLRQALECSDSECWAKVGAKARVTYMLSARGFGKKGNLLLTVALVRASDRKIVGRAQQPLAIDNPASLGASCEDIIRKLRESAAAAVPDLGAKGATTSVAATSMVEGGDTVVNDQPGDATGPATPLAGMPDAQAASTRAPEWKSGFGFVEDAETAGGEEPMRIDDGITVGALPTTKGEDSQIIFGFGAPSFAEDVTNSEVSSYRLYGEGSMGFADNALHSAPVVWALKLPLPRVLLIGRGTAEVGGWSQVLLPLGFAVDWRFVRLGRTFMASVGPDASIAGGFLTFNGSSSDSATFVAKILGLAAEATYGGHLTTSVNVGGATLTLTGGVSRLTNLASSIGSATAGTRIRVYGAATFATLRFTANLGGFLVGVDYRGRMSDTPAPPDDLASSGPYYGVTLNPNVTFAKELSGFIGGTF
ncbi:MAG: hypothetical protein ACAI38_16330 [Myxococcota bacterium]